MSVRRLDANFATTARRSLAALLLACLLLAVASTRAVAAGPLVTSVSGLDDFEPAAFQEVRATGEGSTDTCFFFLVSDYVMADGSLANIVKRMMAGASGILVGNFQVVHEDALPWLPPAARGSGPVRANVTLKGTFSAWRATGQVDSSSLTWPSIPEARDLSATFEATPDRIEVSAKRGAKLVFSDLKTTVSAGRMIPLSISKTTCRFLSSRSGA